MPAVKRPHPRPGISGVIALLVTALAAGTVVSSSAGAAVPEPPSPVLAADATTTSALAGPTADAAAAERARGRARQCFRKAYVDATGDHAGVDIAVGAIKSSCRRWALTIKAADAFASTDVRTYSIAIDLDGTFTNGCGGAEYGAIVGWDPGADDFVGGLVATPSCDTGTWIRQGDVAVARVNDDAMVVSFPQALIDSPRTASFQFGLSTYGVAGFDALPDVGWITATQWTVPGVPRRLGTRTNDSAVRVGWRAPRNTGGTTIVDYLVIYRAQGTSAWTVLDDGVSTETVATIRGLDPGTTYEVGVAARNAAGRGRYAIVTATTTG